MRKEHHNLLSLSYVSSTDLAFCSPAVLSGLQRSSPSIPMQGLLSFEINCSNLVPVDQWAVYTEQKTSQCFCLFTLLFSGREKPMFEPHTVPSLGKCSIKSHSQIMLLLLQKHSSPKTHSQTPEHSWKKKLKLLWLPKTNQLFDIIFEKKIATLSCS